MDSPNLDRVLRIKTNTCRGGVTDGIYMRNVTVGQCREAVLRINLQYEPNEQSKRGFKPTVKNIYMENVTCKKSQYGILLDGLEDTVAVDYISLKNCNFGGVTAHLGGLKGNILEGCGDIGVHLGLGLDCLGSEGYRLGDFLGGLSAGCDLD